MAQIIHFNGKATESLSQDELLEVIEVAHKEAEYWRRDSEWWKNFYEGSRARARS